MERAQLEILNEDVKIRISVAKHFPVGLEEDCLAWRCLNHLQPRTGMSRVRMQKWGYCSGPNTCDYGEMQTMQHLLVCQLLEELCTTEYLVRATDRAISCTQHWKKL